MKYEIPLYRGQGGVRSVRVLASLVLGARAHCAHWVVQHWWHSDTCVRYRKRSFRRDWNAQALGGVAT